MANFIVFLCIIIIVIIWVIIFLFVAPLAIPQLTKGFKRDKENTNNS